MVNNKYITGSKLKYHMDRVKGNKRPITAEFFLTNFCNHRCGYCRFHHGKGHIKFDQFKMYVERLIELGVKGFILSGGGEPVLNPDFDKITEWLEENNIEYGINTNFSKFKKIKPRYLKVSIDAYSGEQYQEFRGVKPYKFYELQENINKYREWQKENGHNTTLGIQSLLIDKGHARKFYEAHKHLDVDYMVFRPMESVKEYYSPYDTKQFINEIDELRKIDDRVIMNYKWGVMTKTTKTCLASWSVITINWNGAVQYCCHKPHEIVGHVMDERILDLKKNYKTDMGTCETPCRLTGSNLFMEEVHNGKEVPAVDGGEHHAFV